MFDSTQGLFVLFFDSEISVYSSELFYPFLVFSPSFFSASCLVSVLHRYVCK